MTISHHSIYSKIFSGYTKTHSKWIKDLNIRTEYKTLTRKHMGKLHDGGFGNDISDMTSKAWAIKLKINWTTSKFKTSVHQRTQSMVWEEIFANRISDKGLISRIEKKTPTTQHQRNKLI